jgi:hypothetical protein
VDNVERFDAAISRFVLTLIPDRLAAARAVQKVLRTGGLFVAIVTGDPTRTTFNAIALDIHARHGGKTDWQDKPGSIRSLVDPVRQEAVMANARFTEVAVIRVEFAFYKAKIAHLPQKRQDAAWNKLEQTLRRFEDAVGLARPGQVNLVVGCKPSVDAIILAMSLLHCTSLVLAISRRRVRAR